MHAANNATVATDGPNDFVELDAIVRAVMRRDLENRWLMRDAVGLLIVLPALRPLQKRMHRGRQARVDAIVERLTNAKLLDVSLDDHARAVHALFSAFTTAAGQRQLEALLAG